MIWNYTDKAELTMKKMSNEELDKYLDKISDETLKFIMFIKLKARAEIYFQKLKGMKIQLWGCQLKKLRNI